MKKKTAAKGLARGQAAFEDQRQRGSEGGGRQTYNFKLDAGEQAIIWFRGLFLPPIAKSVLKSMSTEELIALRRHYHAERRFFDPETKRMTSKEKNKKAVQESSLASLTRRMTQVEPVIAHTHRIPQKPFAVTCVAETPAWDDRTDCVACFAQPKNKAIGKVRPVYCYTVIDTRKQHRVKKGEESKYFDCSEDDDCKWCRKATKDGPVGEARMNGKRRWVVGQQWASMIQGLNAGLKAKCAHCGKGKITVSAYLCGKAECMVELDIKSPVDSFTCRECGECTTPYEEIECSKCDEPLRGSLAHCPVTVSRQGSGKSDTSYNFIPGTFERPPAEVLYWETIDWMRELKPGTTAEVSALLGLARDPYGGGAVGSEGYDDDETSDDDEFPE